MSWENFLETVRTIDVADMLDITLVAVFIYSLMIWFKQTRAAFVARGILTFALLFFVARQAKMYLTTWIFQGFFAVFLIALVVIFQEELRRFFERLAALGPQRKPSRPLQPAEVEILVRTIGQFSRERIGAIVVLKGRDPLDRHISGGYELDGRLSEALLASIFDSHSEGHDGAVIVDGDRVVQFAAQLPLSKEFHKLSGTGTRHAAALGLAERTDALCLVVSEQKGTISIASEGGITAISDLDLLQRRIASFLKEKTSRPVKFWWSGFLRAHTMEKVAALAVAVVLWLVFAQELKPVDRIFWVPVQIHNLPDTLQVDAIQPGRIKVHLIGLKKDFGMLDPRNLKIHVDLEQAAPGSRRVLVTEDKMSIPRSLRLVSADPAFVEIQLAEEKEKRSILSLPFGRPSESNK
ncbi:MAG: diadenylate cyclase [Candidatus Omnitrophica bacterium]|nr:diadenylate cyclase [Candidatus Omnitrophota bacterium]